MRGSTLTLTKLVSATKSRIVRSTRGAHSGSLGSSSFLQPLTAPGFALTHPSSLRSQSSRWSADMLAEAGRSSTILVLVFSCGTSLGAAIGVVSDVVAVTGNVTAGICCTVRMRLTSVADSQATAATARTIATVRLVAFRRGPRRVLYTAQSTGIVPQRADFASIGRSNASLGSPRVTT